MITITPSELKKQPVFLTDKAIEEALRITSKIGIYNFTYLPLTETQVGELKKQGFDIENTVSCAPHEYKVSW